LNIGKNKCFCVIERRQVVFQSPRKPSHVSCI